LNCSCHIVVLLEMCSFCDAQKDYFYRRVNIVTISIAKRDEHFLYSQVQDFPSKDRAPSDHQSTSTGQWNSLDPEKCKKNIEGMRKR